MARRPAVVALRHAPFLAGAGRCIAVPDAPEHCMIFDHIGIVVRDPDSGRAMLSAAFMITHWTQVFEDPVNDVFVQFGRDPSGICYETVAPLSDKSPVRRALADGVNIVNHTAYLVSDLAHEAVRLRKAGFLPIAAPKPAIAYGNKPIQFFMSRTRLLFELIEAPDHVHVWG
jgi:methylmalonyl-CoA/ethylmalonyl-CoA epimerase